MTTLRLRPEPCIGYCAPNATGLRKPPVASPRFGLKAPGLLKLADFHTLGSSTVLQNMWLYAFCIGSRIYYSRSNNERMETVRQDTFGWYNWFMGTPLVQTGLVAGLGLLPMVPKNAKDLMLHRLHPNDNPLKKLGGALLNPTKFWLIATDTQLEQRKYQILSAMQGKASSKAIQAMTKRFTTSQVLGAVTWGLGLLYTLSVLGIGLIWWNIHKTRKNVEEKMQQSAPATAGFALPPVPYPMPRRPVHPTY